MDFDIIHDSRPSLQLQSGGHFEDVEHTKKLNKVQAGICASVGIGLIGLGLTLVSSISQFVAIFLGISLVLGPFAPPSLTGGDCRVGVGQPLSPEVVEEDSGEQIGGRSSRGKYVPRKAVLVVNGAARRLGFPPSGSEQIDEKSCTTVSSQGERSSDLVEQDQDWSSEDIDLLKKLVVKHPRGTLRRWEVVAEGLGGKHSVESVVKLSKGLGQQKVGIGDQDAYSRFLSQRKGSDIVIASPLSQRDSLDQKDEAVFTTELEEAGGGGKGKWTEVEDKALLTALKTFPKDSPMRWDKVALALPGRSKAQCFRRFSDLRKSFRSTIGNGSSNHGQPSIE